MALTQLQDTDAINKDADLLTQEVEKLRLSFEQYFLGLEKHEPVKQRQAVVNLIRKYSGANIKNPRAKFKLQQAIARYNTYTTYWDRVLREIEDGTYNRDIFKAKLHEKERGAAPLQASAPATAGKPESVSKKPDPYDQLFRTYVENRKKCGETIQGLTLESFRKTIAGQIENIKKKTNAQGVKFQVTTENGKTKLKATPVAKK
ncbi:MAG TPA: MXAN_5187 C-terminal domain-containing protein [Bdellovibrionota bacterium]|nr:MXAN_5187 C-terminal domain-containing protein [Bdellovibrionota bacterium]